MALTPKHRFFVKEYLKDRNGARAYRAVYGPTKAADACASRLLKTAKVREAVEKGLAKLEAKLEISAERTLARIAEFAYQPLTTKELKTSPGINSLRACELLAKHFKLLTDVHELGGKDGAPLVVLTMPANGSEAPEPPKPPTKEEG